MGRLLKFITILVVCIINLKTIANAQTEVDERAMINFENGLGFNAPDGSFGINLRFRVQNRLGFTSLSGKDLSIDEVDARIRRLRLRFDGFAFSENITYNLQLSFSRSDIEWDWDYEETPNVIRDAMVYYSFSDNFYIGFGQGKLPGNRQRINSSGQLQFTDRSMVNARFNIDRDFGVMGYYSNHISGLHYNIKTAVSTGEGRNVIPSGDGGFAYTGRVELLPLGRFSGNGDFSEGDLEREPAPKLSVAGGYSFNHKASRTLGQRGSPLYQSRDIKSRFLDAVIKYRGWAALGEYSDRNADDPLTVSPSGAEYSHVVTGYGINMQLSYIFRNNLEIAGRYTYINPENITDDGFDGNQALISDPITEEYTLGVTRYIINHKLKVQGNLGYRITENLTPASSPGSNWILHFQVELGI